MSQPLLASDLQVKQKSSESPRQVITAASEGTSLAVSARREFGIATALVLVSVLPALALWNHTTYLTGDSYQYLRAALTFAQGGGLRDMSGSAFTFFTPFYPLVIGVAHRLTPGANIETTARLVSLVGATTAVIALYWLLRARYSLRVAFSVSLLFALSPLRVWSSSWALSEGLYLGLLMLGLAVLFRRAKHIWVATALGGILLGLAYLTRPEAMLCFAATALLFFFSGASGRKRTLLVLAGFLLVALPYHALVYQVNHALGSGRLSLLFAQSESFRQGQGPQFVYSHQVDQQGTSIQRTPDMSLRAVIARYAFFARWEAERLIYDLGPHLLVLGLLMVGGIILLTSRVKLVRSVVLDDMWQFVLPLMLFVLPLLHIEDRYFLQTLPVFLLWLVLILATIHKFIAARLPQRFSAFAGLVPLAFILVFVLSYAYRLSSQVPQRDATALARGTARWLESQNLSPAPIISQTPDLAFFANASHLWMPGGEAGDVMKYARRSGARYIFVSTQDVPTPLNELLLGEGTRIPESVKLLHEESDGPMRGRLFELKSTNDVVTSNLHL